MKEVERLFKKWVKEEVKDKEVQEFLIEQKQSYFSFLVYFLHHTIRKQKP